MGKYGACGRVYFSDKDVVGDFIKANKRTKSERDDVKSLIWFTIEKTTDERLVSTKVGHLAKTLVAYLTDKLRMEQPLAIKCCDADYARGYAMYLIAERLSSKPTARW